jgi:hypothetical protein
MNRPARLGLGVLVMMGVSTVGARPARARATFVINNLDPANTGFNDPTPAAPVGGNSGRTLGEQRMIAFRFATDIWGKALDSTVPIMVDAHFEPLQCGAIIPLGNARSASLVPINNGVPDVPGGMYYPQALADRIVGYDLDPGVADIIATFNGDIAICDPNGRLDWYYGLDGNSQTLSDLVEVILHEIGHGLGFASGVNLSTGAFQNGIIDTFSSHLYDNAVQRSWPVMSDSQRLASLQNVRHLVWIGDHVMKATPLALTTGAPRLVTQPNVAGLSGNLGEMIFGPALTTTGLSGPLVVGNPDDGCNVLPFRSGAIFLLFGGGCSPLNKADFAASAGGVAMLVTDDNGFAPPSSVEVPAEDLIRLPATIPGIAITEGDRQLLANSAGQNVTVTISPQSGRLVGADDAGRPYLYAVVPIRPGSSVSHWDTLARPDLLEEPETGYVSHPHRVAMEAAALYDIGWTPFCGNSQIDPPDEECDNGPANNDTTPDACRTTCKRASCGDGVKDATEECDSAATNSDTTPDACRTTCKKAACGDGIKDSGEACDLGAMNGAATATCTATCTAAMVTTNPPPPKTGGKAGCSCSAAGGRAEAAPLSSLAFLALALALALLTRSRRARGQRRIGGRGSRINPSV